jgi:hypothetical protein
MSAVIYQPRSNFKNTGDILSTTIFRHYRFAYDYVLARAIAPYKETTRF